MIEIRYINDVKMRIVCEPGISQELSDHFTFWVQGAQFMKKFKNKVWDGKIRLYNLWSNTLYVGLLQEVIKFSERRNYSIVVDSRFDIDEKITPKIINSFMYYELNPHYNKKPITPYSYQIHAVYKCLKNKRLLLLSPTSSGKSLIIYSLIKWHQKKHKSKKSLIVVPTVSLVNQMLHDFTEYSYKLDWNAAKHCHTIMAGREKETNSSIVISTWQSIAKLPKSYFDKFDQLIIDECFSEDTLIKIPNGKKRICNFVPGDKIINFDEKTRKFKTDTVTNIHKNLSKSINQIMLSLEFDNGQIICVTENHKFLTDYGWIKAKNLTKKHNIINSFI